MTSVIKSLVEIFDPESETNMATSGLAGGMASMIILIFLVIFVLPFL